MMSMFERYTGSARRALFFARYETSELRGTSIETEHLLLGLLRVPNRQSTQLLGRVNLTYGDVLMELGPPDSSAPRVGTSVEIPFSHETVRVLQHAAEEADRLGHCYIGVEHLILGLLHMRESRVASILERHGMSLDAERDLIVELLNEGAATNVGDASGRAWPSEAYDSRVMLERVERIEDCLTQLASIVSPNDEAIGLIDQIHLELQSLKPPAPHSFGFGHEEEG